MNPSQRIPGHEPQHERLRGHPSRQPAKPGDLAQGFGSLLEFKMTQIFKDDGRHRHAQSRGKILDRHGLLFLLIRKKGDQAVCQVLRVSGLVKLNRQFFPVSHLAEIGKIRAHDRHPISTG